MSNIWRNIKQLSDKSILVSSNIDDLGVPEVPESRPRIYIFEREDTQSGITVNSYGQFQNYVLPGPVGGSLNSVSKVQKPVDLINKYGLEFNYNTTGLIGVDTEFTWGHSNNKNGPRLKPATPYSLGHALVGDEDPITLGFWTYGYLFKNETHSNLNPTTVTVSCNILKTGGIYDYISGTDYIPPLPIETGFLLINKSASGGTNAIPTDGSIFSSSSGMHISVSIPSQINSNTNWFVDGSLSVGLTELLEEHEYRIYPYVEYQITRPYESGPISQYIYGEEIQITTPTATVIPPPAPDWVSAMPGTNDWDLNISWDSIPSAYLYEVWISGSTYITANTSYVKNIASTIPVTVQVKAKYSNSDWGSPAQTTGTPKQPEVLPTELSIPTNVVATNGTYNDRVLITWTNISTPSSVIYDVYRSTQSNGSGAVNIGASLGGSYNDDNNIVAGVNYYYYVIATADGYMPSDRSNIDLGWAEEETVVLTPVGLAATRNLFRKIEVSFGEAIPNSNISYYIIFRNGIQLISSETGTIPGVGSAAPNIYTDTDVTFNTEYEYTIQGKAADGTLSPMSNPVFGKALDNISPPTSPIASSVETTSMIFTSSTGSTIKLYDTDGVTFIEESLSPATFSQLTPGKLYKASAFFTAVANVHFGSSESAQSSQYTKREAPSKPVISNITYNSMVCTSEPGSTITLFSNYSDGTGNYIVGVQQESPATFSNLRPNISYSAKATFLTIPVSGDSLIEYADTLKQPYGKPTIPVSYYQNINYLKPRTVRLFSSATTPEGYPIFITLIGPNNYSEKKQSGDLWTWLEPNTQYTAIAHIEANGIYLDSLPSDPYLFTTPAAINEPDINLIGFMNDGSRTPKSLLDTVIITSSNPSVVDIKGKQILIVGTGSCRITFEVDGKTTFTDLNIV